LDAFERMRLLQLEDGGDEVVRQAGEGLGRAGAFVDQQVAHRRLQRCEEGGDLGQQGIERSGRLPVRLAVVEHDRQHRRKQAVGTELPGAREVLIEQPYVDEHAQRHEAVDAALEFDEEIEIHPTFVGLDPPDDTRRHGCAGLR